MAKVERLIAGRFTSPAGIWREGEEDPERRVAFPIPAYLIETESERILVDTGPHPAATADPGAHYEGAMPGIFEFEQEQSIADQVDLSTLTMVVLTHLHLDHAGGLSLLPASLPIVVQRVEWEAGHDRAAIERNFLLPRDYAGVAEDSLNLVDGDHDLLGDGSVELLSTPGHTPGHQSVRVGDAVLGGDVAHYAATFDDLRLPIFGDDREAQRRSAERLRSMRDDGLAVQPGHDPDAVRPGPIAASTGS